ncbi:olfactory receptor 6X1-like [Tiliqua scincoides]|uniref:olfactory receptor 6X1-like n=1 Tax=Tiliqua scincoides TaxID=71010 RepID=UPI003462519F
MMNKTDPIVKTMKPCPMQQAKQMVVLPKKPLVSIFGTSVVVQEISAMEKLTRKKYIGSSGTPVMDATNCSRVTKFIVLGFQQTGATNIALFVVILFLYLSCITGNSVIIVIVLVDRQLQKPMYFFLSNFSVIEIGHTTAFMPKMLVNLLSSKSTICFSCCMVQFFFYFLFGVTKFFVLTIMSIDRYLAICQPLRYAAIMTPRVCLQLAVLAWFGGFVSIIFQFAMMQNLPFCGSNTINHFFCDVGAMLKIAGGDTRLNENLFFLLCLFLVLSSLLLTVVSYVLILSTILHFPSSSGRQKAFSTCASHLTVVTILYGAVIFIYLRPTVTPSSLSVSKVVAVLNMMVSPTLNPFIYTIRNSEVKEALRKVLGWKRLTSLKD